ncbi:unnamed protein product [Adineta steineri]|uniref:Uncharacterized protein n=1 Tax=Adineta steineri TaxID=433720 RepID=A0A815F2Y8_9BILA|nr:unnamed protein product [Adineta steineri]CAF3711376.1 unnamed protein product [Adineta steineri]
MDDRRVKKLTHLFSLNKQIYKDGNDCFLCSACKLGITDEFYLRAGSKIYHETCLQCSVCQIVLDEQSTCFLRGVHILCREDYHKYFSNKCSKCTRFIHPNDWIRRACDNIYHLTCFACYICERQLSTGEDYSLEDGHILCKMHVINRNDDKNDDNKQNKTKRIRTAFNEVQLQILQASFEIDQNPDGQELDHISQVIGLSKRVIQVWFQNTRARQKKQKAISQIQMSNSDSDTSMSDDIGDSALVYIS